MEKLKFQIGQGNGKEKEGAEEVFCTLIMNDWSKKEEK